LELWVDFHITYKTNLQKRPTQETCNIDL